MIGLVRSIASFTLGILAGASGCGGPSCETVAGGPGKPSLSFTYVPPRGSVDSLRGVAEHIRPADFFVAVYIDVPGSGGWWIKPYFDMPRTKPHCDGSFITDITTGASDSEATEIAAFLLPNSANPPAIGGSPVLPQTLYQSAVAVVSVSR
jgi:hypothetical protein